METKTKTNGDRAGRDTDGFGRELLMGKAVLISIRPEWVEKIGEGKKTIEVRRTRPKLQPPFKCYIYCTLPRKNKSHVMFLSICDDGEIREMNGKVVGEFVCNKIDVIQRMGIPANFDYCYLSLNEWGNDDIETEIRDIMGSCITKERLNSYAGKTPVLYAWHISSLKVYDKPLNIAEFRKPELPTGLRYEDDAIKRPPQSWCYVEELK